MQHLVRQMADLPNQADFRFVGCDRFDGDRNCIVKQNAIGCHSVYDEETGEPCFMRLDGWRPHVANDPAHRTPGAKTTKEV